MRAGVDLRRVRSPEPDWRFRARSPGTGRGHASQAPDGWGSPETDCHLVGLLERLAYLDIPELATLAGTLDRRMPEIWAHFETGTTNAATEGCNRKVKQVKRVACGFRNHHDYVLRIAIPAGQRHYPAPAG